jgi:hypothetical protein
MHSGNTPTPADHVLHPDVFGFVSTPVVPPKRRWWNFRRARKITF